MRTPRFAHAQIVKLGRLLNMNYRPSELAEEIAVTTDVIYRSYLPAGCPHERDEKQRIWINGVAFRAWVNEIQAERKKVKKTPMGANQGFCMRCKKRVDMLDPRVKFSNNSLEIMQGKCSECGGKVNRARSAKTPIKEATV